MNASGFKVKRSNVQCYGGCIMLENAFIGLVNAIS